MKVNVEIECTPEEARRFMGLPDLAPVQDRYVAQLAELTEGGIKPEMLEGMLRSWSPMGEAGMTLWKALVEAGGAKAGGAS